MLALCVLLSFFFNDTATTEIYTLSLHDALPISGCRGIAAGIGTARCIAHHPKRRPRATRIRRGNARFNASVRSEEHTSELQSQFHLVCRLLLEKKNKT